MSAHALYLGVDGGGTKTAFVCVDRDGAVVAHTTTGTTYHLQVGVDEAIRRLTEGVGAICRDLAIAPVDLSFVFFGLPAFGEDSVIDPRLHEACGRILGHDRYTCGNDMVCGWAGSLACEDGINLVAGTGSIGYGERRGTSARVGGWGEMFGDEGSAYWIAIQGLGAFTRMSDGRLAKGALHEVFGAALALGTDLDLCARIMGERGMTRDEIAGLAILVSEAAERGDAAAAAILDRAGEELAAMARALRRALAFASDERVALSWSGGVLTQEPIVRDALISHLDRIGGFALIEPRHDPGHGAALYARLLSNRAVTSDRHTP